MTEVIVVVPRSIVVSRGGSSVDVPVCVPEVSASVGSIWILEDSEMNGAKAEDVMSPEVRDVNESVGLEAAKGVMSAHVELVHRGYHTQARLARQSKGSPIHCRQLRRFVR